MRATTRFLLLGAFAMCLSACLPEPPMGNEAAIFKRPSRYGWGASDGRGSGDQSQQQTREQSRNTGNRFGHNENKRKTNSSSQNSGSNSSSSDSGSNSDSGSDSGDTASDDGGSDDGGSEKKMTDSGSSDDSSGSSNSGNSAPPSNLNDYPYANLVPGKKGAVTLPGVGEIDVTGIKPGTPVEIDDPNNPGKKIYFRVP